MVLPREFYRRKTITIARELIGKLLVRMIGQSRISGIIYETEAYDGENDLACHARSGKTERNAVMYGDGGYAYVYFTYGMHWMFNCVAGPAGYPAAILVRAIYPIEGLDHIELMRSPIEKESWCNGPAKLTQALSISRELNGKDLCSPNNDISIEQGITTSNSWIQTTPRIGIQSTPEPWKSKSWRFIADLSKIKSNVN